MADGAFDAAFASLGRAISLAEGWDAKRVAWRNGLHEALTYWHGIEQTDIVGECFALAEAKDLTDHFGIDEIQRDIANTVEQSKHKTNGNNKTDPSVPPILSVADFIKGFVPPDYLIDGILQRRFIYSLTGQTGHAKTAVALLIAQLVGSTEPNPIFGVHHVEQGRVVYFVGENPDDVRMRLIGINAHRDPAQDRISIVPGVFSIPGFFKTLEADAKQNGDLSTIVIDTSAAYFLGAEENSNVEIGRHARMLRSLTTLPGGPMVLVLCHPIKHASDPSQLIPRGGGAFLAEMDGNLGLWRNDNELVTLDQCGKFRGPGFQPITFRLESIRHAPSLIDSKGRQLSTVHAVAITDQEEDAQRSKTFDDDDRVLAGYLKTPDASIAEIATANGWTFGSGEPAKSRVARALDRLVHANPVLIKKDRNRWVLTDKGKEAARKVAVRLLNETEIARQGKMFEH